MIANVSLEKIGKTIQEADSILIFPHINPDGDAIGSACGLCDTLREHGKKAAVLLEEDAPEYLSFLDTSCCMQDAENFGRPDLCICVDCSDEGRLNKRKKTYQSCGSTICIDHHLAAENFTEKGFCDHYYIDSSEAACSQIIYKLLQAMGLKPTPVAAELLYTGIVTDTGSFQYSNTTGDTHRIAADLLDLGVDHMKVTVALYQNIKRNKLDLEIKILDTMESFAKDQAVIAYVTEDMAEAAGALMEDAESAIDLLRNIEGVEIAALLKQREEGIKVSLRAKSWGGVDQIAAKFGGGGHKKAAGCTMHMSLKEAWAALKEEIERALEK